MDTNGRGMDLEGKNRLLLINFWRFPMITLVILIVLGIMTADGLQEEHLMMCLFLTVMVSWFSVAGFIRFIKCLVIYRDLQLPGKFKYLMAGLAIYAVILSIPCFFFLQDHFYLRGLERHNKACFQVKVIQIELDMFYNKHNEWPSEEQGLKEIQTNFMGQPVLIIDPWGRPYNYRLDKNPNRNDMLIPHVWSSGPDGVSGTDDDIDDTTHQQFKHSNHWPAA
ncbi:MAG: hypothetical protein GY853_08955 [PVC group bacterium]|nr:hypothetical protein [PVC group bacterium]